jgi:hypothetical protein
MELCEVKICDEPKTVKFFAILVVTKHTNTFLIEESNLFIVVVVQCDD